MLNEEKMAYDFKWRLLVMDQSAFTDSDVVMAIRFAVPQIDFMLINEGSWNTYILNDEYVNANMDPILSEIYKSLEYAYNEFKCGEPLINEDVIEAVGSRFEFITDIIEWDPDRQSWHFKNFGADDIAFNYYWATQKGETMKLPTAVKIWFNPPYTTVLFDDGTKTTARAEDGYVFSKYSGFMACMMKKVYGSTKNCIDMLNKAEEKALKDSPKYKRERERKGNKAARAAMRELEKHIYEQRINDIIRQKKAEREAEKRMAKEEE